MIQPGHMAADDQWEAASAHAGRLQERIRQFLAMSLVESEELTDAVAVAWLRYVAAMPGPRGIRTCPHVGPAAGPMPVVAAAWWPGVVVCIRCAAAGALRPAPGMNFRCDACGQDSPGDLVTGQTQSGPLLWCFGLCPPCGGEARPGGPASPTRPTGVPTRHDPFVLLDAAEDGRLSEVAGQPDSAHWTPGATP